MKAAVHDGKKSIVLTDAPTPTPGKNEYLVKIRTCAICGSDTWWFGDADPDEPVHGHETAGEIVACGEGATRFKVGERVVCYAIHGCGTCRYCEAGEPTHCTGDKQFVEGGFQEYSVYDERLLFPCPPEADWVTASLLSDAIGVPMRGLRKVPEDARQGTVTVWGLGPLGLLQVMFLKAAGAKTVIGIDREPSRLAKAEELGASLTVNSKEQNAVNTLMEATGHVGADSAFVYVRHPQVTSDAFNSTRYDNPVCTFVGLEGRYELQEWYERTLIWSFYFLPSEYQTNLEFLKQHNLDIKQIVSDVFPLEKINEAFTRRFERQDESLKIVVTMD